MVSREEFIERLKGESETVKRTCAALIGGDARSVAQVALAEGVTPQVIYRRRLRLERKLGITLPRMSTVGRPRKDATLSIGLPATFDLSQVA